MNTHDHNDDESRLREALADAYPAADPSDDLHRRVETMALEYDRRPSRGSWRVIPSRLAFAMILLLIVGGTLAYRYLMNRPGEQAIQLIPANALMVVTIDLKPSAAQVPVFKRIQNAIQNQGIEKRFEDALNSTGQDSEIVRAVKPHITNSLAFAMLPRPGATADNADPVLFLSLKDAGEVEKILARRGTRSLANGLTYYRLKNDNSNAAIIAEYLVLSQAPAALAQINQIHQNDGVQSVATLREYQWARSALPEDANFMFFLSPSALAELDKESKTIGVNPFRTTKWFGISATLRDQGIMFDYRWPYDSSAMPGLKHMAQIPPVDDSIYKRLPTGAYGVMLLSQPSRYWDFIRDAVSIEPGAREEFVKGMAEFEKETGISVDRDIMPGLNGSFWLAIYPDPATEVGAVVVFDDANGADPARLADKVRTYVAGASAKEPGGPVRFLPFQNGNVTFWKLDDDSKKALNNELQGAVSNVNPAGPPPANQAKKPEATIVYAQVGRAVLIASSQELLDKAVSTYGGGGLSLADDPAFQGMRSNVTPGSQTVFMVNLAMIMQKIGPHLEKEFKDSGVNPDDIIRLFGDASTGLVASGKYDGAIQTGNFFLPLEYERVVTLMTTAARAMEKSKQPDPATIAL